jgi:hypothetical protein
LTVIVTRPLQASVRVTPEGYRTRPEVRIRIGTRVSRFGVTVGVVIRDATRARGPEPGGPCGPRGPAVAACTRRMADVESESPAALIDVMRQVSAAPTSAAVAT